MASRGVWFDRLLATVAFVACEAELLVNVAQHGSPGRLPVAVDAVLLALVTLPVVARRREPELVTGVSMAALLLVAFGFPRFENLVVPQFTLFVLPYAVAAYARRTGPLAGLALCLAAPVPVVVATPDHSGVWFVVAACGSSWALGRYVRSNRTLTARLQATGEQIAVERQDRQRLIVAEQRSLIARELQAVVADHVSAMTVQARAAQHLVRGDDPHADDAMATIEHNGRETMSELRRLLGVLRRAGEGVELSPQPGVGQIPKLVERARQRRPITLQVDGDPAALPASTDLGLYRIVEEALSEDTSDPVDIALRFGADDIELGMTATPTTSVSWPTVATRERVALCQGQLDIASTERRTTLRIRLPRVLDGALP